MTKNLVLVTKGFFDHKDTSDTNLRTAPQLLDKSCQCKEEDFKSKIIS